MTEPNDPAFPTNPDFTNGLTKREYFAAMALQGLLTRTEYNPGGTLIDAVILADKLIEQLNKPNP